MEEEFSRLDQSDLAQANRHIARWQSMLSKMRNAELLGELVDYHLRTGSPGALKVLLSLKDLHSPVRDEEFVTIAEVVHYTYREIAGSKF